MGTDSRQHLDSRGTWDRTYLESLIREDFERCHPGETLEDFKRRASFSKGGQRPAAGLDGGSGGSRCGRMQGQGIAGALDDPPTIAGLIEGSEPHNDSGSTRLGSVIQ